MSRRYTSPFPLAESAKILRRLSTQNGRWSTYYSVIVRPIKENRFDFEIAYHTGQRSARIHVLDGSVIGRDKESVVELSDFPYGLLVLPLATGIPIALIGVFLLYVGLPFYFGVGLIIVSLGVLSPLINRINSRLEAVDEVMHLLELDPAAKK